MTPTKIKVTKREAEVLELVACEMPQKAVAAELGISMGTVRAHLRSACQKFRKRTSSGAAMAWFIQEYTLTKRSTRFPQDESKAKAK
jgi:DNA-binding NarL/FixJ family response regulator